MKRLQLFSVPVDNLDENEFIETFHKFLDGDTTRIVTTPNPEMLVDACRDKNLREALQKSDLALPDGVGLYYAFRFLQQEYIVRHTGVDAVHTLIDLMGHQYSGSVVLFGGRPNDVVKVLERFRFLWPKLPVFAVDPGLIDPKLPHVPEHARLQLESLQPKLVLVALGAGRQGRQGKQEKILYEIKEIVPSARIIIGVGGAFDVLSGRLRTAPKWMSRFGFEWLWRLLLEPWRVKRIFKATVVFPALVMAQWLREKLELSTSV